MSVYTVKRDPLPDDSAALDAAGVDAAAVRCVRGRGAIDLALGESLLQLDRGDSLLKLGYARLVDYVREQMGVPPRTMFQWRRLARELKVRPLLRRAVTVGAVSARKGLVVLPVARGDDEPFWTAAAMTATEAELEHAVRATGKQPVEDTFETETIWLKMDPEEQDLLDRAIAAAQESLGLAAPRWQCIEAMCQEWLGSFAAWVPGGPADPMPPPRPAGDAWRADATCQAEALDRQLRAIEEASLVSDGLDAREGGGSPEDDPRAVHARIQRLLEARRGFDEVFGPLALRIVEAKVWASIGYRSLEQYCRERLGISARSFRQRVWLERKMRALPALREALTSSRLTYSKVLLVAQGATPHNVEGRIAEAVSTTWQQTEREATEDEERQNRAAGVRRLWGPKDAVLTVTDAILSAQTLWMKTMGSSIEGGTALAMVALYFLKVCHLHRPPRRMPRARKEVLMRHGGLCAVPGCSCPAKQVHHIKFRARGGTRQVWNEVALCAAHHLRGVHRGYLVVEGVAGERLIWRLGTTAGTDPLEEWVTRGDDDVRRPEKPQPSAARAGPLHDEVCAEVRELQAPPWPGSLRIAHKAGVPGGRPGPRRRAPRPRPPAAPGPRRAPRLAARPRV